MTAGDKNAHYRALNDRFDGRAVRLRAMGFKYARIEEYDTACFVKPRPGRKVPISVPASFVMHADNVCWSDRISELDA